MTIKFLTLYGPYPVNAIVSTLSAATETALIAEKIFAECHGITLSEVQHLQVLQQFRC